MIRCRRPGRIPRRVTLVISLLLAPLVVGMPAAHARAWGPVVHLCQVKDTRIVENSGMSRSTYARSTLFVHNDSGGGPQFFAIDRACRTRAVFDVPGAPAKDWEDMASGPDHTLWFGDIGGDRAVVSVVRVKEPRRLKDRELGFRAFQLGYPDGAHNAEALMVHPRSGRLFVVTKAPSGAGIYRAPARLSRTGVNAMTRIADAPQGISGADIARDRKHLVLRGYHTAFVYRRLGGQPVKLPLPAAHTFGEAVAFARDGSLVFGAEGVRQWLWHTRQQ